MKRSSTWVAVLPWQPLPKLLLMGLLLLSLGAFWRLSHAAEVTLGKTELACLSCHDKDKPQKALGNGEVLSLHISTQAFIASAHNEESCEDCHAGLDSKTHGKRTEALASRRAFALQQQDTCRDCHKAKYTQYEDSVHAALIKEGSNKAPLCSDCHDPHTQQSVKLTPATAKPPCARCHDAIYQAYSKDVHGQARLTKGKTAPICADCHQAHAVQAASSMRSGVRDACLGCHKDAASLHAVWLPNTERHLGAISCPACHVPNAQRRVNLRLFDASKDRQMAEKSGVPQFVRLTNAADSGDMGLDERALWSLLKEFNQEDGGKTILRGRLEVRSAVEAHQIAPKSQAIRECTFCHEQGATPFQSVTLTMAGPDGRPLRHGIQKDVLNSIASVDSVGGFYAIGSTRIKLLDQLLVLVLLGAAAVPLGHMAVRRMFKGVRAQLEAERLAAAAPKIHGDDAQ